MFQVLCFVNKLDLNIITFLHNQTTARKDHFFIFPISLWVHGFSWIANKSSVIFMEVCGFFLEGVGWRNITDNTWSVFFQTLSTSTCFYSYWERARNFHYFYHFLNSTFWDYFLHIPKSLDSSSNLIKWRISLQPFPVWSSSPN